MRTFPCLIGAVLAGCDPSDFDVVVDEEPPPIVNPIMEVDPVLLDFGALPKGESSELAFRITNIGTDPLDVYDVTYAGSTSFTRLSGDFPATLQPEGSIEVQVSYSPENLDETGVFTVTGSDANHSSVDVNVLGTWALPALRVTPDYTEFGAMPPNCEESTTILLESVGTGAVTVSEVNLLGDNYTIDVMPPLPLVLEPGEAWPIDVAFLPTEEIAYPGSLSAESDDPTGTKTGEIYGVGQDGAECDGVMTYELEFEVDYKIADIAFIIDTTCSMSSTADAMAEEFGGIAALVAAEIPDITFGVATHDDYPCCGYGSPPDKAFDLHQQQTDDLALVAGALANEVDIHNGNDWEESSMEALYQGATGEGWDMDCDGKYDADEDVKPFTEHPLDAFGGFVNGTNNPNTPGTGTLGGFGFREETFPIQIIATDAPMRDPEAGYPTPGGCLQDASFYDVFLGISALNGKMIGVCANCGEGTSQFGQLQEVAIVTGSMADLDHNGVDEPAVVEWSSGDSDEFRETIVDAILALADSAWFDKVSLEIEAGTDPYGLILDIEPDAYYDIKAGTPVTFTLTIDGSIVDGGTPGASEVLLKLMADDALVLSTRTLYILP